MRKCPLFQSLHLKLLTPAGLKCVEKISQPEAQSYETENKDNPFLREISEWKVLRGGFSFAMSSSIHSLIMFSTMLGVTSMPHWGISFDWGKSWMNKPGKVSPSSHPQMEQGVRLSVKWQLSSEELKEMGNRTTGYAQHHCKSLQQQGLG